MDARKHPEFSSEQEHLTMTLRSVDQLLRVGLHSRSPSAGDDEAEKIVRELLLDGRDALRAVAASPYFGRIDFVAEDEEAPPVLYIGKFGIQYDGQQIYDWRAPISSLFYQSQAGRTQYRAPGGVYRGHLLLKRSFEIQDRALEAITDHFDTRQRMRVAPVQIIDPDEYLQQVIDRRRDVNLREIVATIQARQNDLIRADPRQVLMIQGAAGSGKTSIALHRLAYLLYPDTHSGINAARCIIFGPNRLFLNYISNVLPSLGVSGISQTTLAVWMSEQLELTALKLTDRTLDVILSSKTTRHDKEKYYRASRLKTSLKMAALLDKYLEQRRRLASSEESLAFKEISSLNLTLTLSANQLASFHAQFQDRPFMLQREQFIQSCIAYVTDQYDDAIRLRASELRVPGDTRLRKADQLRKEAADLEQVAATLTASQTQEQSSSQATTLLSAADILREQAAREEREGESMLLSIERQREDAAKISRRSIIQLLSEQVRTALDERIPPLELPGDYLALLSNRTLLRKLAENALSADEITLLYQPMPEQIETLDASDLPALFYLYMKAFGVNVSPFQHIVIDEAQDISPLEFASLRDLSQNNSFTILGDLAQGIYPYHGINAWEEARAALHGLPQSQYALNKSYRSTYEIMSLAKSVLQSSANGQPLVGVPEPLRRRGMPPKFHSTQTQSESIAAVRQTLDQVEQQGYRNIAIIGKTIEHCTQIQKTLGQNNLRSLSVAESAEFKYSGGVIIVPVHLSKGIEFEAVLLVDVDKTTYSESILDMRLLYVALTRATHALDLFWVGTITKHLEEAALGNTQ